MLQALAHVLDEEDTITKQLEKEQDDALESAIQEEETYLKEIEREESTDIVIVTEHDLEADSDLGVSIYQYSLCYYCYIFPVTCLIFLK